MTGAGDGAAAALLPALAGALADSEGGVEQLARFVAERHRRQAEALLGTLLRRGWIIRPIDGAPAPEPDAPRVASEVLGIVAEVAQEVARAEVRHPPLHSAHEGYAVLLEEVEELWEEVRKKRADRDPVAMREEALQVAAMAVRFARDVVDRRRGGPG